MKQVSEERPMALNTRVTRGMHTKTELLFEGMPLSSLANSHCHVLATAHRYFSLSASHRCASERKHSVLREVTLHGDSRTQRWVFHDSKQGINPILVQQSRVLDYTRCHNVSTSTTIKQNSCLKNIRTTSSYLMLIILKITAAFVKESRLLVSSSAAIHNPQDTADTHLDDPLHTRSVPFRETQ